VPEGEVVPNGRKLEGLVTVVSGAGSVGQGFGTGKAMATLFAREGSKVVCVDRVAERAEDTRRVIEEEGGTAAVVVDDLEDVESGERIIAAAVEAFGGVDILINNAAAAIPINILETSNEMYDRILNVNLRAPFMLCRAAIPHMLERGGGSVISISSVAAMRGQGGVGRTAYAASKMGLVGMTTDLADTYGKQGIRFNAIAPGLIATPHQAQAIADSDASGTREVGEKRYDLSTKTCLGIEGDAWDIARAALFLAGPDGRYITGMLMPVDGGSTTRSH
jgi:NAD(P)-dependent dehydrogenase (short-subunit alcohol dehydrogenase family)